MLTLLILLWLRKAGSTGQTNAAVLRHRLRRLVHLALTILSISPTSLPAQTTVYSYHVLRNQNQIGTLSVTETSDSPRKTIALESKIKAKLLFTVTVATKEKTMFENQRIIYAESSRKINDNEEVCKKLVSTGNGYHLRTANKDLRLEPNCISNNTVSLYVSEPLQSMSVFSDAFNNLLLLQKTGDHEYVLTMPDGNKNTYRYKNGICNEVLIDHRFFSAQIILDKIIRQ